MKWRQRPYMTIAVDWDVKYQSKQTNQTKTKVGNNQKQICIDRKQKII